MTIFVAHRTNTVEELQKVPIDCGVEIDLRDYDGDLVLQHDPFKSGELFSNYIEHYKHALMILNIKSEGIEMQVRELLYSHGIRNYFFLDSSFGMVYKLWQLEERNIAARFSEFESLSNVLAIKGRLNWVWVDCFTDLYIDKSDYMALKDAKFRLCLTSPELLGRPRDIQRYRERLERDGIVFDAVCAKLYNRSKWELGG
jgi:hypothetical protein